ncbi:MAG: HypC/HybG/HupF family hydrogenase formation chaperone [Nitrospirota bacterium]
MCLAVPGKIESVQEGKDVRTGLVSFGGISKDVCLALVPEAGVGDYVIVHVGFAISKVNEDAAKESLALLEEMDQANEPRIPPS